MVREARREAETAVPNAVLLCADKTLCREGDARFFMVLDRNPRHGAFLQSCSAKI
ncbi:MAG: hypothetical protein J1D85_06280 [Bacteroidales bacterium]|nr:hypothetical protein [Bacteroidales bacterium]